MRRMRCVIFDTKVRDTVAGPAHRPAKAAHRYEQDYDYASKSLSLLKFQANGGVWQRTRPMRGDGVSPIARTRGKRSLMF